LRKGSVRTLYKNTLNRKLTPVTGNVETDWLKIKQAITKTAEESTEYKKLKNQKWLGMWNDEIKFCNRRKES
jgi:hypothetical protein